MNLPNQLTVSRFVLTVAFLIAVFLEFPLHETVALALFVAKTSVSIAGIGQASPSRKLSSEPVITVEHRGVVVGFSVKIVALIGSVLSCFQPRLLRQVA